MSVSDLAAMTWSWPARLTGATGVFAIVLVGLIVTFAPAETSAATITVSSGGDNAGCTLRNAIASANTITDSGACVATNLPYGNDTVQIPGSIASPIQLSSSLSVTVAPPTMT